MPLRATSAIGSSVAVLVLTLTSCGSSSGPKPDRSGTRATAAPSATQAADATACQLVTPDVLRAARFDLHVVRRGKADGLGKNGSSACNFGEDPDPTHLSLDHLGLLVLPPTALRAQHTTAEKQARATAYPCTASTVESTGPEAGIGTRAWFCVSAEHAPAGGWLQHGTAYLLEVGTPQVDNGTTVQRRRLFTAVARAIAHNVDH